MKAVAESISFNISGRSLTYLLCYSHFWARGSSFLFLLHSTHQTSTFLPTAKILVQLVYIIAMPKRNQVRQGSQHARSCTNPTGSCSLKPKKQTTKMKYVRGVQLWKDAVSGSRFLSSMAEKKPHLQSCCSPPQHAATSQLYQAERYLSHQEIHWHSLEFQINVGSFPWKQCRPEAVSDERDGSHV